MNRNCDKTDDGPWHFFPPSALQPLRTTPLTTCTRCNGSSCGTTICRRCTTSWWSPSSTPWYTLTYTVGRFSTIFSRVNAEYPCHNVTSQEKRSTNFSFRQSSGVWLWDEVVQEVVQWWLAGPCFHIIICFDELWYALICFDTLWYVFICFDMLLCAEADWEKFELNWKASFSPHCIGLIQNAKSKHLRNEKRNTVKPSGISNIGIDIQYIGKFEKNWYR